jgi:hypothetical protein
MNPNDTEESVWAFLCEAQTVGSLAPKTLGDAKLWTGCGFLGPQESATDTESAGYLSSICIYLIIFGVIKLWSETAQVL